MSIDPSPAAALPHLTYELLIIGPLCQAKVFVRPCSRIEAESKTFERVPGGESRHATTFRSFLG